MIKIGLTGSIAMGKSEVARIVVGQGLPLFDADKEVHQLYDSEAGTKLLRPLIPEAIRDGKIDRNLLTQALMKDPDQLKQLEKIIHAEIAQRRQAFTVLSQDQHHPIIVFDIPLLFEKNLDKTVDVSIVVSTPEAEQRKRALARPGMTAAKLSMILGRQMPDHDKRKRANFIIENNGTLAQLAEQTISVLNQIKRNHGL
jgi:dephospho-CoA kinase